MHAPVTRLFLVLLAAAPSAFAQTVEWWERAEDSVPTTSSATGTVQVLATPQGIYAVGQADCDDGCQGSLTKFAPDGSIEWQIIDDSGRSTSFDSVAADENTVYVHGEVLTEVDQGSVTQVWTSSFVGKYTHGGTELWDYVDIEDGPPGYKFTNIYPKAIAVDDTGVYTFSMRQFNQAFLRRFDSDGELVWLQALDIIGNDQPQALAIGDGMLFAAARFLKEGRGIHVYNIDGDFQGRIPSGYVTENGLAYQDGNLYFCTNIDREFALNKAAAAGAYLWSHNFGKTELQSNRCGVTANEDGIYIALNQSPRNGRSWRPGTTVRAFDGDGLELDAWDFPSLVAEPNSVSVLDGEVYVAGLDVEAISGFVARLSGDPTVPPSVALLNPAGPGAGLAMLEHHYGIGPVTVQRKSARGTNIADVAFSDDLQPVDYFAIADLNGNGWDDLAVLSRKPARLEVIDGDTGQPLLGIDLDANFEPVAAAINGRVAGPLIAVLAEHPVRGSVKVDEYDALTGAALKTVWYNPNYEPLTLVALGRQAGERIYAVLSESRDPGGRGQLDVRSTGGTVGEHIFLDKRFDLLDAIAFADRNGAERVAVLRRSDSLARTNIAILNPDTGNLVRSLAFSGQLVPVDFAVSDDIGGNLSPQFSVAGMVATDGTVKLETRDLASGGLLHNVFLSQTTPIQDLFSLGSGIGTPTALLGTVVRDNVAENEYQVVLIDLLTGAKTGTVDYAF